MKFTKPTTAGSAYTLYRYRVCIRQTVATTYYFDGLNPKHCPATSNANVLVQEVSVAPGASGLKFENPKLGEMPLPKVANVEVLAAPELRGVKMTKKIPPKSGSPA